MLVDSNAELTMKTAVVVVVVAEVEAAVAADCSNASHIYSLSWAKRLNCSKCLRDFHFFNL